MVELPDKSLAATVYYTEQKQKQSNLRYSNLIWEIEKEIINKKSVYVYE